MNLHRPLIAVMVAVIATATSASAQELSPARRQALENRLREGAALSSNAVRGILNMQTCPSGQVATHDETRMRSDAQVQYYERHPDREQYRYPTRYGRNTPFQLNNTTQVTAWAGTQATRETKCE